MGRFTVNLQSPAGVVLLDQVSASSPAAASAAALADEATNESQDTGLVVAGVIDDGALLAVTGTDTHGNPIATPGPLPLAPAPFTNVPW